MSELDLQEFDTYSISISQIQISNYRFRTTQELHKFWRELTDHIDTTEVMIDLYTNCIEEISDRAKEILRVDVMQKHLSILFALNYASQCIDIEHQLVEQWFSCKRDIISRIKDQVFALHRHINMFSYLTVDQHNLVNNITRNHPVIVIRSNQMAGEWYSLKKTWDAANVIDLRHDRQHIANFSLLDKNGVVYDNPASYNYMDFFAKYASTCVLIIYRWEMLSKHMKGITRHIVVTMRPPVILICGGIPKPTKEMFMLKSIEADYKLLRAYNNNIINATTKENDSTYLHDLFKIRLFRRKEVPKTSNSSCTNTDFDVNQFFN